MSELKTLKDFQEFGSNGLKKLHYIECEKLRAEAVKWVKDKNKCSDTDCRFILNEWIKHFFNLTEEDLENE